MAAAPVRVLFLGHSFIRRLHDFLLHNFNTKIATNLSLEGDIVIRWHGIGGRTISKTKAYDLHVVEEFAPNIVIFQLGTNDLATTSAVETGSAIEDLCRLLAMCSDVKDRFVSESFSFKYNYRGLCSSAEPSISYLLLYNKSISSF